MYSSELFTKKQLAEMLWRIQPTIHADSIVNSQMLNELISRTSLWDDSKLDNELNKVIGAKLIHFCHGLYRLKYS